VLHSHQRIWGFVRTIGICLVLLALGSGTLVQAGETVQDLEVFVRTGCPHCEAAKVFLKELQRERPAVRIAIYDLADDSAAHCAGTEDHQTPSPPLLQEHRTNVGVLPNACAISIQR
jgi:glutaredoxin